MCISVPVCVALHLPLLCNPIRLFIRDIHIYVVHSVVLLLHYIVCFVYGVIVVGVAPRLFVVCVMHGYVCVRLHRLDLCVCA